MSATRTSHIEPPTRAAIVAAALWHTTLTVAVLVLLRRALTSWEPGVGPFARCLWAAVAVSVCGIGCWIAGRRTGETATLALTFGPPLLLVFALVPSGAHAETLAWLALAVVGATLVSGNASIEAELAVTNALIALPPLVDELAIPLATNDAEESDRLSLFDAPEATLRQAMERSLVDGCDSASGRSVVEFAVGQRIAAFHAPFVPAFGGTPECEVEIEAGADGSAKTTLLRPYGVRIEIRRSDVVEAASTTVAWSAWLAAEEAA